MSNQVLLDNLMTTKLGKGKPSLVTNNSENMSNKSSSYRNYFKNYRNCMKVPVRTSSNTSKFLTNSMKVLSLLTTQSKLGIPPTSFMLLSINANIKTTAVICLCSSACYYSVLPCGY